MSLLNINNLKSNFPENDVFSPDCLDVIKPDSYYVYILSADGKPIVAGHGKKNRARVIFDSRDATTNNHIKSLIVRLYHLYGGENLNFARYLIQCQTKDEARSIERKVHKDYGGNSLIIPKNIQETIFNNEKENAPAMLVLKMALCSSYSGLNDLRKWRKENILDDQTWQFINNLLKLEGN